MKKTMLLNSLAVCIGIVFSGQAWAVGKPTLVAGDVSAPVVAGSTTTINQNSANAVIEWNNFNIANGETVKFNQPTAGSAVLNRVMDTNQTTIDGMLAANGRVFVVNPSGVVFGENAQVNVGSLVASTLDISNNDFMKSPMSLGSLNGNSNAFVINKGVIKASEFVHLQGGNVTNSGSIISPSVTLASREKNTSAVVDRMARPANLRNRVAPSVNRVVNTGTIRAMGIENKGGVIRLIGQEIEQNSTLEAGDSIYMRADNISIGVGSKTTAPEVELISANSTLAGDITAKRNAILNSSIKVVQRSGSIDADDLSIRGKGAYFLTSEDNKISGISGSYRGNKFKSLDLVTIADYPWLHNINAETSVKVKTNGYLHVHNIKARDISLTNTDALTGANSRIGLTGNITATNNLHLSASGNIRSHDTENVISANRVDITSGESVSLDTIELTSGASITAGSIRADKINISKLYGHKPRRISMEANNGITFDHYPLNAWITHIGEITVPARSTSLLTGLARPPVVGTGYSTRIMRRVEMDPGFGLPSRSKSDIVGY